MVDSGGQGDSDSSRADLFDSLGHPVRIKILQALSEGSLGFGDLKRKVGIESNGNLQYHLGRLDGLVRASADGDYALTDDGREALRMVASAGEAHSEGPLRPKVGNQVQVRRALLVALLAALVLLGSAVVYQQLLLSAPHQTTPCGAGTEVIINSTRFCGLDVTANSEILVEGGYTRLKQPISYKGVNFTTSCGNGERCGNIGCPPFTNNTCVMMSMGAIQLNMVFPDGTNETVNAVIGDTWPLKLSQHSNPRAGFEMLGPYASPKLFLLVQEP
jgi:DNA-binding HxlR family transcriptional regulator